MRLIHNRQNEFRIQSNQLYNHWRASSSKQDVDRIGTIASDGTFGTNSILSWLITWSIHGQMNHSFTRSFDIQPPDFMQSFEKRLCKSIQQAYISSCEAAASTAQCDRSTHKHRKCSLDRLIDWTDKCLFSPLNRWRWFFWSRCEHASSDRSMSQQRKCSYFANACSIGFYIWCLKVWYSD